MGYKNIIRQKITGNETFLWIKQADSMQCGAACLTMICRFYGNHIKYTDVTQICVATISGITVEGIEKAAEIIGFIANSYIVTIQSLSKINNPCILHWNQNHFVVLYKVGKGKTFYIANPAKGLVKYNLEDFKKHWVSTQSDGEEKGIAMFLEPTPAFYEKQTDEQPTEERSFKFLFGYIKQYRKYFGQIVLGLLVGSVLQLILPFLTQSIVDVGIKSFFR